jgi:hypothetical protein
MHFSLAYSCQSTAILPRSGLSFTDDQGHNRPCSPYELNFSQKPHIGRFRVFSCPIVANCDFKTHPVTKLADRDRSRCLD